MALENKVAGGAAKSNSHGSTALFNRRYAFKIHMLKQNLALGVKNIVDFNTGEKMFYGRINYESLPIFLRENASLTSIKESSDAHRPARVLPFVADLFHEMVIVFRKAIAQNQIAANTRFLSDLRAYRGHQSAPAMYKEYQNLYLPRLGKKIKSLNPTFTTLDEFIPLLLSQYGATFATVPFTYSTYIRSRYSSIMSSGLAIEIADLEHFNDNKKLTDFVNSGNWSFFVTVCNNHGFMIDAHQPFRIVADLSSTIMRERAGFYGYSNVKVLFARQYRLGVAASLRLMIRDLLTTYKAATAGPPVVETVSCNGEIINRPIVTTKYTLKEAYELFSSEGLLMVYCHIKLAELRPTMDPIEKEKFLRDIRDLYTAYNKITIPLIYFEEIISKTFDSIGSFSYYKRTLYSKLDAMFESGAIDAIEVDMMQDDH